jgi:hypothetical protein
MSASRLVLWRAPDYDDLASKVELELQPRSPLSHPWWGITQECTGSGREPGSPYSFVGFAARRR